MYLGTVLYEEFEWPFTATSHGKGDIDGLGGTTKRRVQEATLSRNIDPQTAEEFSSCTEKLCPNINILYVIEEIISSQQQKLDTIWCLNNKGIQTIPETRKMHFFKKVSEYEMKCSLVSTHTNGDKTFNFIAGLKEDILKN